MGEITTLKLGSFLYARLDMEKPCETSYLTPSISFYVWHSINVFECTALESFIVWQICSMNNKFTCNIQFWIVCINFHLFECTLVDSISTKIFRTNVLFVSSCRKMWVRSWSSGGWEENRKRFEGQKYRSQDLFSALSHFRSSLVYLVHSS